MTLSNFWRTSLSEYLKAFFRLCSKLAVFAVSISTRKPRVAVYSVDIVAGVARVDLRALEIYRLLHSRQISYFEFIHVASLKRALLNALRRRRPSYYLIANDSHSQVARLKGVFKKLGVRRVVAIDDYRHTAALSLAAKELGISSVAMQHGCNFTAAMFPESRCVFDKLIVWSDFFAEHYQRYCPEQSVVVCPHPRYLQPLTLRPILEKTVLLIEEIGLATEQLEQFLLALTLQTEFSVCLRMRPGQSVPSAPYRKFFTDAQCLSSEDVFDDLSGSSVVVGSYSSLLYQALLVGCGVVVCKTAQYTTTLVEANCASLAQSSDHLLSCIVAESEISDAQRHHRRELIWGGRNDGEFAQHLLG